MPTRRDFLQWSGAALSYAGLAQTQALFASAQPSPADDTGAASLAAHAARTKLPYGCAVVPERLGVDTDYTRTIVEQCSILVAENSMKWRPLRPTPDTFNFAAADKLMTFAQEHAMQVRGHNLCWHQALPVWFASTVNPQNAEKILVQHIQTVAGRYAGRIHSWDVVNEAVHPEDGLRDGMRNSPWMQLLGERYIDIAFHTARKADPHALLTYNDYNLEYETPAQERKREAVLALLHRMRQRGVPIDAVGVQSHLHAGTKDSFDGGLQHFMKETHKLNLQVFITEMDVDDSHVNGNAGVCEQAVADVYKEYMHRMLQFPWVTAALTWGITNRYTWLNHEHPRKDGAQQVPLPFEADYAPAKAFYALRESFDRRKVQSSIQSRA
jgi:endo-1,4-beta-xylanase